MENGIEKKIHGNKKYFKDEDQKIAVKESKANYMAKKQWNCCICNSSICNKTYLLKNK